MTTVQSGKHCACHEIATIRESRSRVMNALRLDAWQYRIVSEMNQEKSQVRGYRSDLDQKRSRSAIE
jgi:hypothetical protein